MLFSHCCIVTKFPQIQSATFWPNNGKCARKVWRGETWWGGWANKTWWPDDCFLLLFHCSTKRSREKITYSILLLARKLLSTFTNKMFLQVKRVIGVGATGNIPCIILQAAFFEGKSYTSAAVNSHLKTAKIGKSQCRKVRGKNTRVTYLYQSAFDKESLDIIMKGEKESYCREKGIDFKTYYCHRDKIHSAYLFASWTVPGSTPGNYWQRGFLLVIKIPDSIPDQNCHVFTPVFIHGGLEIMSSLLGLEQEQNLNLNWYFSLSF